MLLHVIEIFIYALCWTKIIRDSSVTLVNNTKQVELQVAIHE